MEIKKEDFYRDFVKRTKEELGKYKGEREFTMLLNLTFGLLLVPYEAQISQNILESIWNKSLKSLNEVFGDDSFTLKTFEPIKGWNDTSGKYIYYDKTLGNLLRKLRNGLAHAHLEPVNEQENWVAVKIWNCKRVKKKELDKLGLDRCDNTDNHAEVKDLEIEFTWEQLRKFAIRIADEHLKHYDKVGK